MYGGSREQAHTEQCLNGEQRRLGGKVDDQIEIHRRPHVPVLVELYVGREYRRRGAGSALVAAVIEAARAAGKAGVSLGVHPDNAKARRLVPAARLRRPA